MNLGDLVELKTKEKVYRGRFVPSLDKNVFVLKLENGYNVGIEKKKVLSSKVIESFKETSISLPKIESKSGLRKISILHTGGTLASKVSYTTGGVSTKFSPEEVIAMFPELKEIAHVETRLISNMFSGDMCFA